MNYELSNCIDHSEIKQQNALVILVYILSLKCLQEHLFHPQKMTDFIPNKVFLRGVLLHYFTITQDASESYGILEKVYGGGAISEGACHNLFKLFKIDNYFGWERDDFADEDLEKKLDELKPEQIREKEEVDPESYVHYFTGKQIIQKKKKYLPEPIPSPQKLFLRIVLLHCFNMKENASESHSQLEDAYGLRVLSERTCRKWFKRFKSGNFNLEDGGPIAPPKKFEDEDLKTLLGENSSVTQEELAKTFGVTQQTISQRLKAMGIIRKEGNWIPSSTSIK